MATELPLASPAPMERPLPEKAPRRPDLLLALTLAALVFSWNYTVERVFERDKVFDQFDVLFDSDPITRLLAISQGKGDRNDLIIHPGFKLYFSRAIRLVSRVSRQVGVTPDTSRAEHDLRRELALLVTPAVSGLTMAVAYALFTCGALTRPRALLMTLICCTSFSQLIFGSVPDHMPVSSLLVTALLLLAHDMSSRDGPLRWGSWALVGGLYAGTTITNAAPFVILFATARVVSGRAWRPALGEVLLVSAAMLTVTASLAATGFVVAGQTAWPLGDVKHHATHYKKRELHRVPTALLESFAPASLARKKLPPAVAEANLALSGRAALKRFETAKTMPAALLIVFSALLVSGTAAWCRGDGSGRAVSAAAVGVIAFHMLLHSFWGSASFLYSQHWLVPVGFLLAGNLTWPGIVGRAFTAIYGVAGFVMFFHNVALLNQIFTTLAATPS
jgi:hypothetical protein